MNRLNDCALLITLAVVLGLISGCAVDRTTEITAYRAPLRGDFRTIKLRYTAVVKHIPTGTKQYRLWLPLPSDSAAQRVREVKIKSEFPYRITRETKYGNRMIFFAIAKPPPAFSVAVSMVVERVRGVYTQNLDADRTLLKYALEAHQLAPHSLEVREKAARIAGNLSNLDARAKVLRQHTLSFMQYSKAVSGWGRGDYARACSIGKGNCTDIHWYFITLCRNLDIPARFVMGLTIPETPTFGEASGYHCWAYYWQGSAWLPVDISEAGKHPGKFKPGYYYADRVAFSYGRDLTLNPRQQGGSVTFFSEPYGEADGRRHMDVSKKVFYENQ